MSKISYKTVDTHTATIYCGFKIRGASQTKLPGELYGEALDLCQEYCDRVGLCVSIKETNFIYTKGYETGVEIGLINYPRFGFTQTQLRITTLDLAEVVLKYFKQCRVTVVFDDETVMLTNDDLVDAQS